MTSTTPGRRAGRPIIMIDAENGEDDPSRQNETAPLLGTSSEEQQQQPRPRVGSYPGSEDFDDLPWYRRPSVFWLVGPFLIFTLAFGGVLVPKLNLIVDLVCHEHYAEKQESTPAVPFKGLEEYICDSAPVQKKVAEFTLILQVLTGLLGAVTAPKIGALSDRYGRVRLLVVASIGGITNEIIAIIAARFPGSFNYRWLILGAFFDGMGGSFTAGGILTNAYASDCSPPSKRGVYIGYLQACLFGGLAFGPLIAGYLVKWTGSLVTVFYVTLGCHLAFITFVWAFVPESLSKKRQMLAREKYKADKEDREAELRSTVATNWEGTVFAMALSMITGANPFAPLRALAPKGHENRKLRRNLILLTFIDAVLLSTAMGAGTVIVLYTRYLFHWGALEAGRFISATSLIRVFILLGLIPALNYCFRVRPLKKRREENGGIHIMETNAGADQLDMWMLRVALLSDCCGIVGYIVSRRPEFFVMSGFITAFGGLGSATIMGAMTKHVPTERVGALLGAMGQIQSLGRVAAPIVFNGLYAATVETFPQAFFVLLLSLFAIALLFAFFVRPHIYLKDDNAYTAIPRTYEEPSAQALSETLAVEEEESEVLPHLDR